MMTTWHYSSKLSDEKAALKAAVGVSLHRGIAATRVSVDSGNIQATRPISGSCQKRSLIDEHD